MHQQTLHVSLILLHHRSILAQITRAPVLRVNCLAQVTMTLQCLHRVGVLSQHVHLGLSEVAVKADVVLQGLAVVSDCMDARVETAISSVLSLGY